MAHGDSWRLTVRGGGGHDLLTISPVLESADRQVAVAPIGLVTLMNSGGAVLSAELAGELATPGCTGAGLVRLPSKMHG